MIGNTWKTLQKEFEAKKLLILGEMHGAEVNPRVIKEFVNNLGIQIVMLELETKWKKTFNFLKRGGIKKFQNALRKERWFIESGLIGQEHIPLFRELLKNGINLMPVKVEHKDWNIAEERTAENVLKVRKEYPQKRMLLVMGKLHARKKPFLFQKKRLLPIGARLSSISIQIRYAKGSIYNFRKITFRDNLLKNKKAGLIKSSSAYFDYDYVIRTTKPIKLL